MPYAASQGARIFWEEEGSGEPVLLIMGLGYPAAMWYRILPYLTDRYRTIRFDNRGVGSTGVPPGPYSVEQMADDAAAVLDGAGEGAAHVVGASLGGVIAQELALRHPDRVHSLVLACTHCAGPEAVPPSPEALAMLTDRSSMTPADAAEAALPFVYAPATPRLRIDEDVAVRMRQPTEPRGYANQLEAAVAFGGTWSRLPSIAAPTLIVHGVTDRLIPPANGGILAERIPGSRLEMLEGASHVLLTDQTERTGRGLRDFLDAVSSS